MVKWWFVFSCLISASSFAASDPTAPLDWTQSTSPQSNSKKAVYSLPKLQSIICVNGSDCQAIMGNKVLERGQVINGFRVINIDAEFVTVSKGKRQWKLELFSKDVKQ
ncbi:MSHA biogenesis protein MshK [Vibrio sp. TRT 21S02]|uniref:MSHA biogenesis protein MshK n=1 Tax=unclassified Vibrio TaxID=2614977 RepID=UPI003CED061B